MKSNQIVIRGFFLFSVLFFGRLPLFGDSKVVPDQEELRVYATTSILGDVVQQVLGEVGSLTVLFPRGQTPHSYKPSPRIMSELQRGDLIFINGFDLEETLVDILKGINLTAIESVSRGLDPLWDEDHGGEDPHVWFSPQNVIIWTQNIKQALISADPENSEEYEKNTEVYIAKLKVLDDWIQQSLSSISPKNRMLVMDHATLSYFARDYDFEIIDNLIPSFSDQAEPSAQDLARIIDTVRRRDIRVLFVGDTISRSLRSMMDTVAREIGGNIAVVELLTGSLAPLGERGDSYLDFIRYNTTKILESLQGKK